MRKAIILAVLLMGGVFFTGTPAKADLGCVCVKLGSPAVCTSGVGACTLRGGGVCVLPCDYKAPKSAMKKSKAKKKKM